MIRFLAAVWIAASPLLAAPRPNVVFILCDDLGIGDSGTFFQNLRASRGDRSEPWQVTPKLDELAAHGLRLTDHYCPAPVCAPSRASLLTGRHQGHANVRDNQFDKALENHHTLGSVLRQAGYATAAIGKWGLQGKGKSPAQWPAYPTKRGFDFFHGYVRHADGHEHYPKEGKYRGPKEIWENESEISAGLDKCYTTDLFTARAKKWIADQRAAKPDQPFFLYLAYDTPHAVIELPTVAYPAGGGLKGGLQWTGKPGEMINTATGTIDSYYHPDYAAATWDDDKDPATAEVPWPDVYKRYATSVRRIDDCVGDLRQTLGELGIGKDTLIVFTTDNGPSMESYLKEGYRPDFFNSFANFDGIKRDVLEGGVRVGAIACWPTGIPGGRTSGLACQFHDWLPTFAELAGVPAPARGDGTSLVPTLTNRGTQAEPVVYVEYEVGGKTPGYPEFGPENRGRPHGQMQMIRLGTHVGVRTGIRSHDQPFAIYDVAADPGQRKDLAAGLTGLQQRMKDRVLALRRPDPAAPRPYDKEPVPAIEAKTAPGVAWKTYAGEFPWVPEFTVMKASSSGAGPWAEIPAKDSGILLQGFLKVPQDGEYTFSLALEGRAVMKLHDITLIDEQLGAGSGRPSDPALVLKAGLHPFRIYGIRRSGKLPVLSWSGPSLPRAEVPGTALFRGVE